MRIGLEFHETYSEAGNQSSYHSIEGADHVFADPDDIAQVIGLMSNHMINLGYLLSAN